MAGFQIMPAKFVNLIQFFELKILAQGKAVFFVFRSVDGDAVVPDINMVDPRP